MKQIGVFILVLGTLVSPGYCETPVKVDIAIECIDAYYESDAFGTPRYFETPSTQKYFGLSGDRERHHFLELPIVLTLRFHQETVEGEYTFVNNRKKTIRVKGRVDTDGHLVLHENIFPEEHFSYTFQGKLTEQEIIGMWAIGYDRNGFLFFATLEEHSPWLRPVTFAHRQSLRNATDRYGNTYLHIMARHRQTNVVKRLLDDVNVNVRNQEGRTPLYSAVDWKQRAIREKDIPAITDVVNLLLSHGADVNVRDKNGVTPLTIAQESGLEEVVDLLREYGAEE